MALFREKKRMITKMISFMELIHLEQFKNDTLTVIFDICPTSKYESRCGNSDYRFERREGWCWSVRCWCWDIWGQTTYYNYKSSKMIEEIKQGLIIKYVNFSVMLFNSEWWASRKWEYRECLDIYEQLDIIDED